MGTESNGNGKALWQTIAKTFGSILLILLIWLGGMLWADVQDLKAYRVEHNDWSKTTLRDVMDSIRVVRQDVLTAIEDSRDSVLTAIGSRSL